MPPSPTERPPPVDGAARAAGVNTAEAAGHVSGVFVVLEGGEGVGKSTQVARIARERDVVTTFEPGATALGATLRQVLLAEGGVPLGARAEALLMAADRAHHVAEVIAPALAAGRLVVSDRHAGSSVAYQGYGRGLPLQDVRDLSVFATGGLRPDLVILLDMDPEVALAHARGADRFEALDLSFHRWVRDGYLAIAAGDPDVWVIVDATQPADAVNVAVDAHIDEALRRRRCLP